MPNLHTLNERKSHLIQIKILYFHDPPTLLSDKEDNIISPLSVFLLDWLLKAVCTDIKENVTFLIEFCMNMLQAAISV